MSNLNALVDAVLHPDIPYFDEEHLIVGGITGLVSIILFGLLTLYVRYLNKALSNIKTLESILPICSHCKKIRKPDSDPKNMESWQPLEAYITDNDDFAVQSRNLSGMRRLNFIRNFMETSGIASSRTPDNSIPQTKSAENEEVNTMKELLQKAWLFGAGVFDFTKDKVEALVQEMVRRGEITQQESSEAVKQLLAKAQEAQQGMVAKVKELTKSAVDEIKVAKASDLEALEARVAALEEALKGR